MNTLSRILIALVLVVLLIGSADAQRKGRKLQPGAYIESAQINMGYRDTVHYKEAVIMLDSLILNWGPHPEGYALLNQIWTDWETKVGSMEAKKPIAQRMAAYRDSLHYACSAPDSIVESKFKKKCDELLAAVDSSMAKTWRILYSNGFDQYQSMVSARKEITPDMDSATRAYNQNMIDSNATQALANMELCIVLDSTDGRAYVMTGTILEQQGKYAESSDWLDRGLRYTTDSAAILMQIAYNKVQQEQYCEATPYFREYLKHQPQDTTTLTNLAISFNNCKMYDSAAAVNREILQLDPAHSDALSNLGLYFNQMGRNANDTASAYRQQNNEAAATKWTQARDQFFDSSKVYFRRAWDADSANVFAGQEYGVIALVTGDYQAAADAYHALAQVEPDKASHWISLGDAYLNLQKWTDAAAAYEKVVELEPDNRQIWERLYDLYTTGETKNAAKAAEAKKHL